MAGTSLLFHTKCGPLSRSTRTLKFAVDQVVRFAEQSQAATAGIGMSKAAKPSRLMPIALG